MRRLTILGLAILFVLGTVSLAAAAPIKVGVAWAGKAGMAERVLKGLQAYIKAKAPQIELEVKPALGSMADLAKTAAAWSKTKAAMVLLRSNAATWLGKNPPAIPTFIGGCNNPTLLGAVKNLAAPEGKITGVTYYLPVKTQFEVFKSIVPGMKSVVLLVEKGHPGTVIDTRETKEICAKLGIQYIEKVCASKAEVLAAVRASAGKVSAFIIGNQSLVIDMAAEVVKAAGKTPVLAYSVQPVKAGALGGFVADDEKLGWMLGESLAAVLIGKKAVKDVPVKIDPKPKFYLNVTTAERLGAKIPYEVTQMATIVK